MSPPAKDYLAQQMSEQEYLESEPYSDVKREYIDGYIYAMAGATPPCALDATPGTPGSIRPGRCPNRG